MAQLVQIQGLSGQMQDCIENCDDCRDLCTATVNHCLELGGVHATPANIRLLLDCAEICQTSASFMLRGSDLHRLTCGVCADICARCADECEQLAGGDAQMLACARACRACSESCERMAS
ncbi:MAG: hypothetical protein JWM25_1058 [Thermoleophilia bacterium]|nr:hypothetical protein [Thermoleophilia bacterium]MCZ4496475.1 hypothetical protein [Thermoleophilia bacterium]